VIPRDVVAVAAAVAAWWGAWCGTSGSPVWWASVLVLGGVLLGAWGRSARVHRARNVAAWPLGAVLCVATLVTLLAGASIGAARSIAVERSALAAAAESRASGPAEMLVSGDPRPLRDGRAAPGPSSRCSVPVRVERFVASGRERTVRTPAVLMGADAWCALGPGNSVRAVVRWSPSRDRAVAAIGAVRAPPRVLRGPGSVQRAADLVRDALREASTGTPFTGGALVPALVVGDESLMPESVVDDLRGSGLAHLSAVSGANVAIVLAVVLVIARRLGARSAALTVVGVIALAGFVVLARPEPSVLRAGVMGGVVLLAAWRGGTVRPVALIAAAVLMLVLVDPWLARSPGFALSVAATAGLVVLVRRWSTPGDRRIRTLLLTTLAAQLAVAPIIAGLNGRLDIGGVIANVLAEPAVAPATVLGLSAAMLALIHPVLGHAVAVAAAVPAQWIVMVADVVASRRWAWLPWPTGWMAAMLLAVLLAAAAVARWLLRRSGAATRMSASQRGPSINAVRVRWRAVAALATIGIAVVGVPIAAKTSWPAADWRVVMCDVGQGDALVLATGPRRAVLVDVGPDARQVDRCLRDLGIARLDLLVLTHFHADHVNGLRGAVRGRVVDQVLVSPLDEPEANARDVREVLIDRGIPIAIAVAGRRAGVGPWQLEVLAPTSLDPGEGSAPNNASVVLRAERDGRSILLMGDAELAEQRQVVTTAPPEALVVDVLKVAHHGSAVQDPSFMALVAPRLALVPVGCRNRYGHPSPPLMRSFARARIPVARSDLDGDVAVVDRNGSWGLVARGPGPTQGPSSRCQ
jgi:competence protein ComEC